MLSNKYCLSYLKKEMEFRKLEERYENIIGSIVYYTAQKEIKTEFLEDNLENIVNYKRIHRIHGLKVDTNLSDIENNEQEHLKKYKQCTPIKRNSFKKEDNNDNNRKFYNCENEETRL